MMNPNASFLLNTGANSYSVWTISEFFDQQALDYLGEVLANYPYKLTQADRTEADGPRVWCHEEEQLAEFAAFFADPATKEFLSHIVGKDITCLRTRVELCMDRAGSWLRPHVDDKAKKLVLQIYLSDGSNGTNFGSKTGTTRCNSGWMFQNTGNELHELNRLPLDRASILVNYVDHTWRDKSVLVEQ